jgi:antitoxin ParD1/3/4
MASIQILITETLKTYIEERAAQSGRLIEEYLLALVEQDQKRHAQEKLDALLLQGLESLEQGEGIHTTDEWWNQERDRLVRKLQQEHP